MRLSGTTAIRHGFGFKDCQVWIKENLLNKNFQTDFNVISGMALRYETEIFLGKAKKNERAKALKEVKRLCKDFGFTAETLKGALNEVKKKQ